MQSTTNHTAVVNTNATRIAVIYPAAEHDYKATVSTYKVEMTNEEIQQERVTENARLKSLAGTNAEYQKMINSFDTNVNAKGKFYMSVFRDLASQGSNAINSSMQSYTETVAAMMGAGNYVLDLMGAFNLPSKLSDESYDEFLVDLANELVHLDECDIPSSNSVNDGLEMAEETEPFLSEAGREFLATAKAVAGHAVYVAGEMTLAFRQVMQMKTFGNTGDEFEVMPVIHVGPLESDMDSGIFDYELVWKPHDHDHDEIRYSINDRCGALIHYYASVVVQEAFDQFETLVQYIGYDLTITDEELQRRISRYLESVKRDLGLEQQVERDLSQLVAAKNAK